MKKLLGPVLFLLAILGLVAIIPIMAKIGGSDLPTPTPEQIKSYELLPIANIIDFTHQDVTVKKGGVVHWNNRVLVRHSATADNGEFDTGPILAGGSSGEVIFNEVGKFPYHCEFHPDRMKGTVTVVE